MLEGKMLRGLTGTPMRRIALANSSLADAEPEPLTLANLTTKSLTAASGTIPAPCTWAFKAAPRPLRLRSRGLLRGMAVPTCRTGLGHLDQRLLHVPRTGGAALRAQPAVQAHVLVLDHDPAG